jgi:hypothetical protein
MDGWHRDVRPGFGWSSHGVGSSRGGRRGQSVLMPICSQVVHNPSSSAATRHSFTVPVKSAP